MRLVLPRQSRRPESISNSGARGSRGVAARVVPEEDRPGVPDGVEEVAVNPGAGVVADPGIDAAARSGAGSADFAAELARQVPGGKRMIASRVDSPPVLDGLVNDTVWQTTDAVGDFLQREPREGGQPSERTEARMVYDDDNLYFGFILYDSDPNAIRATQLRRDSLRVARGIGAGFSGGGGRGGGSDDTIAVLLDTFHDHRNAFLFAVNSLGTKYDATVRGESQINGDWDERWEAAARVTERGWEAELAIPWAILRYNAGNTTWGVDFRRDIRRKNEEVIWTNYRRDYEFIQVSQAGHLAGLENLTLTERFRFKPYVIAAYDSLQQRLDPVSEGMADFGVEDFKIKLNSNLTSQLTYNTDFAQVEVDEQRVNLTRFSLFFPEKREFFLEAANNFSFGPTRGGFGPPVLRMYHSRNIGLADDGTPLPIDFGAKITGKIGRGNLGLLNVQTGDSPLGPGRNFTTFRWRQDVLSRSSIGAFATNVQGADGDYNRVVGVDTNFTFFENLNISAFAAQSRAKDVDGGAWVGGMSVDWNSDLWQAYADITMIEPGFRNDLGFVLRRDIVRQDYEAQYKPRPSWPWLRQVALVLKHEQFNDLDGRLISIDQYIDLRPTFESGDSFFLGFERNFERLDLPFAIHPEVTIPAGDYWFTFVDVGLGTNAARTVSANLFGEIGGFYDGTRISLIPGLTVRFSETFTLRPQLSFNKVDLPGGSFTSNVARLRTEFSFSDRVLTDGLLQYNSLADELSLFARLRYIYQSGDSVYLVYRQARIYDGTFPGAADRSLIGKMTYAFQW